MLQASVVGSQHIMASKKPDLLTVRQAAEILGLSLEGIRAAIKKKDRLVRLEAYQYGSVYLIERSALERYRDTRKMGRPPKKAPGGRAKTKH